MDADKFRSLFDLRGRVAIVTGGTRGIGRAIAEGLVLAGARVVVASRKPEACATTADELTALGGSVSGGSALGVAVHMGDLDAIDALVHATVERFGRLDIVVNNAANGMTQPIAATTPDAWDKSYSVNLRGPVFLAKAAYPHLCASPCAAVLNVITVGAITWSPSMAMYTGAKAALLAFTRNMAAEWAADGIRVNALAPGTVDTDMLRSGGPGTIERVAQISLMKRTAHVDEMVGPALLLVSDAGSYMTGQMIVADGGYAVAR
jgi:NAD(P)-dependent dehydrogenase (short-subunit alcohol dehydrogenase family)